MGIEIVGLIVTALTAILGASASIATALPSRSKLLKDIEIFNQLKAIRLTDSERLNLFKLRASIGRQLETIAEPSNKYLMISTLCAGALLVLLILGSFTVFSSITGDPIIDGVIKLVMAWPLGYLCGKLPFIPTKRSIERRYKQTREFFDEFQSELGGEAAEADEESSRNEEIDASESGGGAESD